MLPNPTTDAMSGLTPVHTNSAMVPSRLHFSSLVPDTRSSNSHNNPTSSNSSSSDDMMSPIAIPCSLNMISKYLI